MSKLEDTARGILETLLKRRISDQAWDRDKKKMQLLGIPLDQSGVRLYVTLKSHITQNLDKIIGVQNIPNRQMSGREIVEDMESRKWMPKSFSTFQRWFEDGFSVRKTYGELEVTLAYLKAFIYQKKHNRLPKQLGESNDHGSGVD